MNKQIVIEIIQDIKKRLTYLEKLVGGPEHPVIKAGWDDDYMYVKFEYGPNSRDAYVSEFFSDDPMTEKKIFPTLCKGIHTAIGFVPMVEAIKYMQPDGPQIVLKISNPNFFNKDAFIWEEYKELKEDMLTHFEEYRIKIEQLTDEEWKEMR